MPRLAKAILTTGLLAGSLDIIAAFIWSSISFGSSPLRVLQYIASGVFGPAAAFSGGGWMAALGLVFHFIIALSWTMFFYILYPRISMLSKNKIVTGIGYGIFVWIVMNLVVLPLTNVPHGPITVRSAIMGMAILVVAIGIPISLRTHRYTRK